MRRSERIKKLQLAAAIDDEEEVNQEEGEEEAEPDTDIGKYKQYEKEATGSVSYYSKGMKRKDTDVDNEEPEEVDGSLDEDEIDGDEEEEYDEEDSESEVGIGRDLPKRSTRGARYTALTAEELEVDREFWGHETWNEANEKEDADYNCSEGEDVYKDIVDSDFDIDENEEDEPHVDEEEYYETKKKKKNVYVDSRMMEKKKLKEIKKQKSKKDKEHEKRTNKVITNDKNETLDYEYLRRSKRKATQKQTHFIQLELIKRENKKKKLAERREKNMEMKGKNDLDEEQLKIDQEWHLEEAKYTELYNTESLLSLQASEEEKKKFVGNKKHIGDGQYNIWISWLSCRPVSEVSDVTIDNSSETTAVSSPCESKDKPPISVGDTGQFSQEILVFPDDCTDPMYQQEGPSKPIRPRCCVTGNVAKYLDRKTGLFYDSAKSFKVIQQWYFDEVDKIMTKELAETQAALYYLWQALFYCGEQSNTNDVDLSQKEY